MTDSEIQQFISLYENEDVEKVAFKLQGNRDAEFILRQIEGRQVMAKKVPRWASLRGIHYPRKISLEQSSGEAAALYKARLAQRLLPDGGRFVDITGGLGVDFSFIALHFQRCTYVEQQAELCALARHNFPLLGLDSAEVLHADGVEYLKTMENADLLFADPARRDSSGRKVVLLNDCEPDVTALNDFLLTKAHYTILKLSPMLDIQAALRQLKGISEVHVLAEHNECKELLLVMAKQEVSCPTIFCHDDHVDVHFCYDEERNITATYADCVENYLYEPDVALLKAAAYNLLCQRYGVKKLHPNSHLYTSSELVCDFPGRTFKVIEQHNYKKKEWHRLYGKRANVAVRNFNESVAQFRKRLKISDGGDEYWFATTLRQGEKVIIRTKKSQ